MRNIIYTADQSQPTTMTTMSYVMLTRTC